MPDANDHYSNVSASATPDYRQQYATRSRPTSQQYIPQEQSAAARRYSPMRVTPTPNDKSQYVSYSPNPQLPRSQHSPTRPGLHQSQSQPYYPSPGRHKLSAQVDDLALTAPYEASRAPTAQLPPIHTPMSPESPYYPPRSATQQLNAVFGRDDISPIAGPSRNTPIIRGQVPQFTKCANVAELRPQLNAQPLFRRANPEGGFISVSKPIGHKEAVLTCVFAAFTSSYNTSTFHIPDM